MIFVYKSWTAEETNPKKKLHGVSYIATAENDKMLKEMKDICNL